MTVKLSVINDSYPTCRETFVTLRLYHSLAEPHEVTAKLGLSPSKTRTNSAETTSHWLYAWFLSSKEQADSKDMRRHLEWLLSQLKDKDAAVHQLQNDGWKIDISCYWLSESGHGGPTLSPPLMKRLAELHLEIWFDVYFIDT